MTTTKEDAARIRTALKAKGWNAKDVSIRTKYYSMGSSVYATIRSAHVHGPTVERILKGEAEQIAYCQTSGEILGGCNQYVHLDYTDDVKAVLGRRHVDALRDALLKLDPACPSEGIPIAETEACVWWSEHGPTFKERRIRLSNGPFLHFRLDWGKEEERLTEAGFQLALMIEKAEDKAKQEENNALPV